MKKSTTSALTEYLQKDCEYHNETVLCKLTNAYISFTGVASITDTDEIWHDIWAGVRIPVHNVIRENLLGTVKNFLIGTTI